MDRVPLYELAHGRTGDKGDRSNISVIAFDAVHFEWLVVHVTEQAVAEHFRLRRPDTVRRFLLPRLHAMNLVLDGLLDGGVNEALNLDSHGKTLSSFLLELPVPAPPGFTPRP